MKRGPQLAMAALCLAAAVAALVSAGESSLAPVPWALAGALVAMASGLGRPTVEGRDDQLQRHLMRCRRQEEPAWVLVARLRTSRFTTERLLGVLRATDSLAVRRVPGGWEIQAVFNDTALDCIGFEERLTELAGGPAQFAWVRFPDDGVTLEALIERGRRMIAGGHRRASLRARAVAALPAGRR